MGKPVTEAGLHVKMPFIQQANYFDKRILQWDGDPNEIPTKDKDIYGSIQQLVGEYRIL